MPTCPQKPYFVFMNGWHMSSMTGDDNQVKPRVHPLTIIVLATICLASKLTLFSKAVSNGREGMVPPMENELRSTCVDVVLEKDKGYRPRSFVFCIYLPLCPFLPPTPIDHPYPYTRSPINLISYCNYADIICLKPCFWSPPKSHHPTSQG